MDEPLHVIWADVLPPKIPRETPEKPVPTMPVATVRLGDLFFETIAAHNKRHFLNLVPAVGKWMIQGFYATHLARGANKLYWTRERGWVHESESLTMAGATFDPEELEGQVQLAILAKNFQPEGEEMEGE